MKMKEKKIFEVLKRKLYFELLNGERGIDTWKLQFRGKAMVITEDMLQKVKLYSQESYFQVRRARFLENLNKKSFKS